MKKFYTFLVLILLSAIGHGQISVTSKSPYLQSFSSLSGSWQNNNTLPGWYAYMHEGAASGLFIPTDANPVPYTPTEQEAACRIGHFSTGGNSSLGFAFSEHIPTGENKYSFIILRLKNNTSQTLNTANITYTGRYWYFGGSPFLNDSYRKIRVSYQKYPGSYGGGEIPAGTEVGELEYMAPHIFTGFTPTRVNGNQHNETKSAELAGLNLAPGQELVLMWKQIMATTLPWHLGIDDVSVTFPEAPDGPPPPTCTTPSPAWASFNGSPCSNSNVNYGVIPVNNTTYAWSYTGSDYNITFGQGSNAIGVYFGQNATSGTMQVVATKDGCAPSASTTGNVTITSAPPTPAAPSGQQSPCAGTSQTYTTSAVAGATYEWKYGNSTYTTSDPSVTFTTVAGSNNLTVRLNTSCGWTNFSDPLTITGNANAPAVPGAISALYATSCRGSSNDYVIANPQSGISYNWSYSGQGVTINSIDGQPTSVKRVTFAANATVGTLSVTATNSCNITSDATTLDVNPVPASQPGAVSALYATSCQGLSNDYVIADPQPGVVYSWSYSGQGVAINAIDGQPTSLKRITFGANATAGILTVTAANTSGCVTASAPRTLFIDPVPATQPGTLSSLYGTSCRGLSDDYSIANPDPNFVYTWSYTGQHVTINSIEGQPSSVKRITFAANATAGSILVTASKLNGCPTPSEPRSLAVSPVPPVQPGAITGVATVCQGDANISYTVSPVAGATSYTWAYTGTGATINGSGNSVTINFATNATSGVLSITANNNCGVSAATNLAITVNNCTAAPEIKITNIGNPEVEIADGDNSPSATDSTHFGNVNVGAFNSRTFRIRNTGTAPLNLIGNPPVVIGGAHASDFVVSAENQPGTSLPPNAVTTFTVRFTPSAVGTRMATINIQNNDGDENPYNFAVSGTGACIPPATPVLNISQPTCAAPAGTITVASPVGTGLTYSRDGINYQSSATFVNVSPGTYNITVKNASGCISDATTAVINNPPAGPAAPVITSEGTTIPCNSSLTLSIQGNIPRDAVVKWYKDRTEVATGATYAATAAGNYQAELILNGCSSGVSNTLSLTVATCPTNCPVVISHPQNTMVCAGSSASFSTAVNVMGTNPSYQWQVSTDDGESYTGISDDGVYSGAATLRLDIVNAASAMDQNRYRLRISAAGCDDVYTVPALLNMPLTINTSVTIAITSGSNPVCEGGSVTFTATPVNGGENPAYQWTKNGMNIPDANSAVYTAVAGTDFVNGDAIRCKMTSSITCASPATATSAPIAMTVNDCPPPVCPVITASPQNASVCAGGNTSFSAVVNANGANPAYQWQVSTDAGNTFADITNGGVYSGVNQLTLNITGAIAGINNYQYRLQASATGCENVYSGPATLMVAATVTPSVTIAITNGNNPACTGSSVTFTATPVNGGTSPAYQWTKNGENITNATSAVYTGVAGTDFINGDAIRCVMTSDMGCASPAAATSSPITMNITTAVTPSVVIAITNGNNPACAGSSVTFTATPTNGGAAPAYQWTKNGLDIPDATAATYTAVAGTDFVNGDAIRCVMTSELGCASPAAVTSAPIAMTVNNCPPPDCPGIATQPVGGSICAGGNTSFSAQVSGSGIYQWQVSTDGGSNYSNISNGGVYAGVATATLQITGATIGMNNYRYRLQASATDCNTVYTDAALLSVAQPPLVINHPQDAGVCTGGAAVFSVTATAASGYQWQMNNGSGFTNIAGAVNQSLVVSNITPAMNGYQYRAVVTGNTNCTAAISNPATLTVHAVPTVTLSAAPYTRLFPGLTTTITAAVSPGGGTYRWFRNGTLVPGQGSASKTVNIDELGEYRMEVRTDNGCVAVSNVLTIADSTSANTNSNLFVYPNPSNGQFQLRYQPNRPGYTSNTVVILSVYNSSGVRLFTRNYTSSEAYTRIDVDMRNYGKGVFFLTLHNRNGTLLADKKILIP